MHVDGKSGRSCSTDEVPEQKRESAAEGMEGSRFGRGQHQRQTTASQTQSWGDALSGLARCAGSGQRGTSDYSSRRYFTMYPFTVGEQLLRLEARRSSRG